MTSGGQAVTSGSSNPFTSSGSSGVSTDDIIPDRAGIAGAWSGSFRGASVQSEQVSLTINGAGNAVALFDVKIGTATYTLDAEGPLRTVSDGSIQGTISGVLLRGSQIEPVTWQLELRLSESEDVLQGSWVLITRSGEPFASDTGTIRLTIPEQEQDL